jgi:Zn-dependent M28 family amino/carboxypeptidase
MKYCLLLACSAAACFAQLQEISADRIRAQTKFLSSDLLEGRGVGSRGGALATDYIATQLALIGAKPAGDNSSYFQRVPLVGVETKPTAVLSASGQGKNLTFKWSDEYVGVTQRQQALVDFDAEAVFAGHGIVAPEFNWDDFKGTDVRGKVVVLFTNEPPSEDPKFFGGRALTYYGRWTYKYEEALRRGAAACLIVHTTPTAGYGWEVVNSSWGKEDPQSKLAPGERSLAFAGWLSQEAGQRLFAASGKTLDEMLKLANSREFRPIPLRLRIEGHISSSIRKIESRNVIGLIPGSDAAHRDEAVVFTAHWDHLGIGKPVNGDAIYNGAVDNGTGCAMVLEIARAWAALSHKPRRSAVFAFVTAEEAGLRGSEYYGKHPAIPAAKTALDLNFDAFEPFGLTKDVTVTGAERTSVWPIVQDVAKRFRYEIKPDARPEQGSYFRSDHFSLARVGIPAFSISAGNEFWGKPPGFGDRMFTEFNAKHYHQPSDEYQENWDFSGLEQLARFGFTIGMEVADQEKLPERLPVP